MGIHAILTIVIFFVGNVGWSKSKCSTERIIEIDSIFSKTKISLGDIYHYYKQIDSCNAMDGGVAEGYQEKSNRLLAEQWDQVLLAKELKDSGFRKSLLLMVNDGSTNTVFNEICANAKNKCPQKQSFCKEVLNECRRTEDYIKKLQGIEQ
ncbi:hypothetical protein DOM22_10905 [Bdellovibrio sp. ZAP7]|uniref:hypothetical protein n=1 Tax=Bdellovibrio sp. ZAP7 TaxID=2231053 RepID=UPI00115C2FAE|nr:hypothetical protein [Bdellovibrio sp. ZAP7]QDK45620.1 hypothetical protein DOM22_10905 [Bdellovibrio sp. ZAP7]